MKPSCLKLIYTFHFLFTKILSLYIKRYKLGDGCSSCWSCVPAKICEYIPVFRNYQLLTSDRFYWLEKSRDASPQAVHASLPDEHGALSSSKLSSSSIPFSSSQMFSNLNSMSFSQSPGAAFSQSHSHFGASPASLLFAHHNGGHYSSHFMPSQTPPTPSLLSAFSANTLLSQRRLRLIASMFSQMCEAVAVCHDAGVSHRDIKPENFICCDSVELEAAADGEFGEDEGQSAKPVNFGPQAKRKVIVKLTDFGLATTDYESGDVECGSKPYMSYGRLSYSLKAGLGAEFFSYLKNAEITWVHHIFLPLPMSGPWVSSSSTCSSTEIRGKTQPMGIPTLTTFLWTLSDSSSPNSPVSVVKWLLTSLIMSFASMSTNVYLRKNLVLGSRACQR